MLADVGSPDRSGIMSEAVVTSVVVAELLTGLPSLAAPVVPLRLAEPGAVGVPEMLHVMLAPAATDVGGTGTHVVVRPAGKPLMAQVADVAVSAGEAAFVHVNVPL